MKSTWDKLEAEIEKESGTSLGTAEYFINKNKLMDILNRYRKGYVLVSETASLRDVCNLLPQISKDLLTKAELKNIIHDIEYASNGLCPDERLHEKLKSLQRPEGVSKEKNI